MSWLNFTVTLSALAAGLLNFGDKIGRISAAMFSFVGESLQRHLASASTPGSYADPTPPLPLDLTSTAMAIMIYALLTYHWRASAIRNRGSGPYDDRFGPTVLSVMLLIAVLVNFILRFNA